MSKLNVVHLNTEAAQRRDAEIEGAFCELDCIQTLLELVVDGERFDPCRSWLLAQLHKQIAATEKLVRPNA